jgi:propionyl-CoA carboxylase alpha chain
MLDPAPNQKVIEEAPSPLLDEATRRSMGEQAVALAKAVGYDSAGTVEFVAGQDRSFYFLEMNTRLQVEHPVTEMITGLDLVEEMIRVAAGEPLRFAQPDVRLDGWAVESRIYAEDPTRGFLPSTGRLVTYRPPQEGLVDGAMVRNDAGVGEGGEISIYYDPMIAKLVTHAPTREEAIDAQRQALDAFAIEGIRHNIPFLSALMAHPRWREGRLSTGFIAEEFPDGFAPASPTGDVALRLAAIAAAIDHKLNERKRGISGQIRRAKPVRFERDRVVMLGSERHEVTVGDEGDGAAITFADGTLVTVSSDWRPGEPVWLGSVGAEAVAVQVRAIPNGFALAHAGASTQARVYTQREAELAALMPEKRNAGASKQLLCPMPGLVKAIQVTAGQEVKVGEPLAIVEAMKMENVLRAERDATIARVVAREGESLQVDAVILEFA